MNFLSTIALYIYIYKYIYIYIEREREREREREIIIFGLYSFTIQASHLTSEPLQLLLKI